MSWQGQPAVIRSTGGTAAQSRAVMSPRFGTCGVAGGQDGGGVPVGLGAPGQPRAQDGRRRRGRGRHSRCTGCRTGAPGRRVACQACRARAGHAARCPGWPAPRDAGGRGWRQGRGSGRREFGLRQLRARGARKISTSSCTIRCQGSPRRRALRMLSSWKNDGRGISWPPRSPASSATHRAAGISPAARARRRGRRRAGRPARRGAARAGR